MALGSTYTKGIEIQVGGNSTGLKVALNEANRAIKTTQTELDTLKNNLKIEWNADNFRRAQELAQRAVQQTADKAATLKQALEKLDKQGDSKNVEQYEAIQRELSYVQVAAQKSRAELAKINQLQFSALENSAKQLTQGIANTRETISATQAEVDALKGKLQSGWDMGTFVQA